MAELKFFYGAMDSGKSNILITSAYGYDKHRRPIATIKPEVDTKGDNLIVSRAGLTREVDILAPPELNIHHAVLKLQIARRAIFDCIMVDEAQFLHPDQIGQLHRITRDEDIPVVAYGLRADFQTKLFPGSQRLFEIADTIQKMTTRCRCGAEAEFNTRKVNDVYVFDGDQVAIDGEQAVTYDSLCGGCYSKEGGII